MIPTLEEMEQKVFVNTTPDGHTHYIVMKNKPAIIDDSTRHHPSLRPIARVIEELVGLSDG